MEILKGSAFTGRARASSKLGFAGVLLALMAAVLFSANAYAQESVGRILAVKGPVSVTHAGEAKPVAGAKNAPVYLNDRLKTGKGAKLKLLMKDESIVTLGQNTEMVVDTFVYNPETNTRKSVLKLVKGMVRNLIAKSFSGLGSVFQVKTPTAVAGAMGTENLVWVFKGSAIPDTIASRELGVTDISRLVLNSQFEGGRFMDYGSPGSVDWLRLAELGGGAGGDGGLGGGVEGNRSVLVADAGDGGGPDNTLGLGISNDTVFGNENGEVVLNNGFASLAPEGQGPTEPFLLPPGTFNTLLGATDLSDEGGGEGGDDSGGAGGGRDTGGGDGGLQGAKDDMQDTLDGDDSGGLDGFAEAFNTAALGDLDQYSGGIGGDGGGTGGDTGGEGDVIIQQQQVLNVNDYTGDGEPVTGTVMLADGFEGGTLDAAIWQHYNAYVTPIYDSISPVSGSGMAMITNAPDVVSGGFLSTFLNIDIAGNYSIAFDFNFATNEAITGENPFDDFFTAFIETPAGGRIDLAFASVNSSTFVPITNPTEHGAPPYFLNSQTGWKNVNEVAALPVGQSKLNFVVIDRGDAPDYAGDSAAFIDNVSVTQTTAAPTVTETGGGLAAVLAIYRGQTP